MCYFPCGLGLQKMPEKKNAETNVFFIGANHIHRYWMLIFTFIVDGKYLCALVLFKLSISFLKISYNLKKFECLIHKSLIFISFKSILISWKCSQLPGNQTKIIIYNWQRELTRSRMVDFFTGLRPLIFWATVFALHCLKKSQGKEILIYNN